MDFNIRNLIESKIETYPWSHQIIDNFFDPSDFIKIENSSKNLLENFLKETPLYGDSGISLSRAKEVIGEEVYDIIFNSNEVILDNLVQLFDSYPNARRFKNYISTPTFHVMPPNSTHAIHDESYDKTMSIVVYLYPSTGIGTALYTSEDEQSFVSEVNWKPNRSLIFCGETKKTWHSFYTKENPRLTLNYFLRQSILETIEDEGENYSFKLSTGHRKIIPKNKYTMIDRDLIMSGKMVRSLNG